MTPPARTALAQRRVLIVDDDPLMQQLLRLVLDDDQFEVRTAVDGIDALRCAAEFLPSVIVLDVMMPGMDGIEVCRTLRRDERFSRTKILMLTARASGDVRDDALAAGADAFFTKPFSPLDLMEAVRGRR
ncbi:MAG TPA: response regulator [Actinomycetota bacterium]|nr:response regulator [Actinomycetota bacterium]